MRCSCVQHGACWVPVATIATPGPGPSTKSLVDPAFEPGASPGLGGVGVKLRAHLGVQAARRYSGPPPHPSVTPDLLETLL